MALRHGSQNKEKYHGVCKQYMTWCSRDGYTLEIISCHLKQWTAKDSDKSVNIEKHTTMVASVTDDKGWRRCLSQDTNLVHGHQ